MQKLLTTLSIHHHFHLSDLLLLFYLPTIREILCMICLSLNILYEVYNLEFFLIIFLKRPKKLSNDIICDPTPHNAYVITPYIDSASFSSICRRNNIYMHRNLNFLYSSSNPIIICRAI